MWIDVVAGGAAGAATGVVGALVVEALHLALRRARNAPLVAAGEAPFKDEVFRPKWKLLGAAGLIAGAAARGLGAGLPIAVASALALPLVLAVLGAVYLRR